MPDAPTSSGSSRSRRVSASSSQTTAHRRLPGHSRSPRTGSSPSSSSNSAPEANSPPAAPQAAAMAASASTASSNRGQKPLPRYSRTQLCLEVLDIISFFSMLAATACGAAFCILVFDAGGGSGRCAALPAKLKSIWPDFQRMDGPAGWVWCTLLAGYCQGDSSRRLLVVWSVKPTHVHSNPPHNSTWLKGRHTYVPLCVPHRRAPHHMWLSFLQLTHHLRPLLLLLLLLLLRLQATASCGAWAWPAPAAC
jgi:hypothetical protein